MSYTAYKDLEGIIIIHEEDGNEFALIDQEIWIYPDGKVIQRLYDGSHFRGARFTTFTLIESWKDLVPNLSISWLTTNTAEQFAVNSKQEDFLLKYL